MSATQERYDELWEKLPDNPSTGEGGKVYYQVFCDVVELTKPCTILEIGFNRGSSALAFLLASDDSVVYSVDVRTDVEKSVRYLQELFPDRFFYIQSDSTILRTKFTLDSVDLVYIDGGHTYDLMRADTETALQLNAPYILMDEYHHKAHGASVKRIISELNLQLVTDCKEKFNNNPQIFCALVKPGARSHDPVRSDVNMPPDGPGQYRIVLEPGFVGNVIK